MQCTHRKGLSVHYGYTKDTTQYELQSLRAFWTYVRNSRIPTACLESEPNITIELNLVHMILVVGRCIKKILSRTL